MDAHIACYMPSELHINHEAAEGRGLTLVADLVGLGTAAALSCPGWWQLTAGTAGKAGPLSTWAGMVSSTLLYGLLSCADAAASNLCGWAGAAAVHQLNADQQQQQQAATPDELGYSSGYSSGKSD
jgi:hypothetical protein